MKGNDRLDNFKTRKNEILCLFLSSVIFLSAIVGCGMNERSDNKELDSIEKELSVNCSSGTMTAEYFSEADGSYCYMIKFSNDSLEKNIKKNNKWKEIPTTDELEEAAESTPLALLWGWDAHDDRVSVSPYLAYIATNSLIPDYGIEGYYFFANHSFDITGLSSEDFRAAGYTYNFTFAVYDKNDKILYCYKINTMKDKLEALSSELGADITEASVTKEYWKVGNDIPTLSVYNMTLKDDSIFIDNEMWSDIPLSETVAKVQTQYFSSENIAVPTVKNGYYYYKNYLEDVEETNSFDVVLAIYDSDTKTLYYRATWNYGNELVTEG